jgi:hypothetical protein
MFFKNELLMDVENYMKLVLRKQEQLMYTNRLLVFGHPTELSIILENDEKILKVLNFNDNINFVVKQDFIDWLNDNTKGYYNIWISGIRNIEPTIVSIDNWTLNKDLELNLINNIRIDFCQKQDAMLFKLKY